MIHNIKTIIALALVVLIASCSSKDDDPIAEQQPPVPVVPDYTEKVYNVDVILPSSIRTQWQHTIDWAMNNIEKAQLKEKQRIRLNLRYHDEDKEDLETLGYDLTHPKEGEDTCHAVIGPYNSSNAMSILKYAQRNRLPVVMPSCTSAELQRINTRNTYAWFLTESDITQCEIMLAASNAVGLSDVALIYSDDSYGKSFYDWFSYYATERNMNLMGKGMITYSDGTDLTEFLTEAAESCEGNVVLVSVALSNATDYLNVCNQCANFQGEGAYGQPVIFKTLCSDTSYDDEIIKNGGNIAFELGVSPVGAMAYGFSQALEGRYQSMPSVGEAQMYDALTIVALGAAHQMVNGDRCIVNDKQVAYTEKPFGPGLTDHMRAVVSNTDGEPTSWTESGLALAFSTILKGKEVNITGASSGLVFDKETSTKILNTTYMIWQVGQTVDPSYGMVRKFQPMMYLSTSGSSNEASTTNIYEIQKLWVQDLSSDYNPLNLPGMSDNWAVVISPSTSWANYRHQADAFAMYQTLRNHGYDDDHIVLIVEDNLADDPKNVFPGQIFVERSNDPNITDPLVNDDVRKNVKVDYHFSDLTPEDLVNIMTGQPTDRLPEVIHPTATSDVFFFWSGHGGSAEGPIWGNEDSRTNFGTERIRRIVDMMSGADGIHERNYRRLMFAIETCFSGRWGMALEGCPDVLVLTAATAFETSKADIHNGELGVYLSNAFARTFRRQINTNNRVTLYDLYRELARMTPGSHVSIYNHDNYGSVYDLDMGDYFPE